VIALNLTVEIPGIQQLEEYQRVAETFTLAAARVTADRVAAEARAREQRQQTAGYATGKTAEGIAVRPMTSGLGFVVLSARSPMPNLPLWIERGTREGKPGSHAQEAHPFLDPAAKLEESAHRERMWQALDDAAEATGLGG
jgi:hypothetical protein